VIVAETCRTNPLRAGSRRAKAARRKRASGHS